MKTRLIGLVASFNQFSRRGMLSTQTGNRRFEISESFLTVESERPIPLSQLRILTEDGSKVLLVRFLREDDYILVVLEESFHSARKSKVWKVSGLPPKEKISPNRKINRRF